MSAPSRVRSITRQGWAEAIFVSPRSFRVVLLAALILRVYVAVAFSSIHWPDEIFQALEPAHRLAFGKGIIPWEFRAGVRSWVFPAAIAGVMRLTAGFGRGSSAYLVPIKIAFSIFALVPVLFAYKFTRPAKRELAPFFAAVLCAVWYELIFFAPRPFTEVVSCNFLLLGVLLTAREQSNSATILSRDGRFYSWLSRNEFLAGGVLCGIAMALRVQQLPAVGVLAIYCCRAEWKHRWLPFAAGTAIPLVAFGTVDAFTWTYPFQSTVLIFWINIVRHKAAAFGIEPWYYYVQMLWRHMWPIVLLAIVGVRRSPLLALLAAAVIVPHSMIAHKEFRYIYTAIPILLTLAALGIGEIADTRFAKFITHGHKRLMTAALLTACVASSALLMRRIDWTTDAANLKAYSLLSTRRDVCGVGLWGIAWQHTGGYAYLHRNVPIFVGDDSDDGQPEEVTNTPSDWMTFQFVSAGANYMVANEELPEGSTYRAERCWGETCLYKREGTCKTVSGYDVNKLLEWNGE